VASAWHKVTLAEVSEIMAMPDRIAA